MEQQNISLFQDLKLKRKRVRDLLTDSEMARSVYSEGCESDIQSDISGDSAYVSDRSSECGASAVGEETPLKKKRSDGDSSSKYEFSPKEGGEGKGWCGDGTSGGGGALPVSSVANTMAYMQGYLMPVSAGFPSVANMASSGLKFIPMMGLPAQGMFPNMPSAPMFIAAPPTGYLFTSAESITTPTGPILAFPPTTHHSACHARVRKEEEQEDKKPSSLSSSSSSSSSSSPPNSSSPKFKEPPAEEGASRLEKDQEFITHYTNGNFMYTGHLVENPHNKGHTGSGSEPTPDDSDGEETMVCAICNDKATGLHYGIITCEGCKGFFKRTVQNKRVYTCVADGDCEINKIQRNRCQYCRFKKCLRMGMVLAAVREDRMPGGRNSGAVYNLYKVKYKKHKRRDSVDKGLKQRLSQQVLKMDSTLGCPPSGYLLPDFSPDPTSLSLHPPPPHSLLSPYATLPPSSSSYSGGSLSLPVGRSDSEADTGVDTDSVYSASLGGEPSSPLPLPPPPTTTTTTSTSLFSPQGHGPGSAIYSPYSAAPSMTSSSSSSYPSSSSSSSSSSFPSSSSHAALVTELARKESLLCIAEDYRIEDLTGGERAVAEALCRVGDDIVLKLVQWMRHLPFHAHIPLQQQTRILTSKWHELLLLIMTAYGPISGRHSQHKAGASSSSSSSSSNSALAGFAALYQQHMGRMQQYLERTFGKLFSLEQLDKEIGGVMERITRVMLQFAHLGITRKELAVLQVILLLSSEDAPRDATTQRIVGLYQQALQHYILERFPSEANRFGDLLAQLPEIRAASHHLLHSKMIYIPFLLNS